uniref:hypothetical protein n=1 Tax=uncultured Altererythrobacter sp. TaxID=500840 RepID=UPI00260C4EC6|nr:hypothetical protein [uncultured Altererythrobacter sp.]
MTDVTACELPEGSLLARYGGPGDYRDCFSREVPGDVSLEQYIERFYSSMAFAPERLILGLIGRAKGWDASEDAIRALARGEADRFGAWEVIERRSGLVAEHGERPASRKGGSEVEDAAVQRTPARPPAGPEGRGDRSADALRNTKTRREEILLLSKDTNTASWLSVSSSSEAVGQTRTSSSSGCEAQPQAEPVGRQTRLLFGSWVGGIDQSGWRAMLSAHVWYSRVLLGGC